MDAYDVVVAGGGPVGLMVAAELGLRGVSVAVLERLAEPSTTIKAGGLNTTTVDAFDRRGLLPELTAAHRAMVSRFMAGGGAAPPPGASRPKIGGHFAGMFGMDPARVDPSDPDFRTGPGSLVSLVPQPEVERILAQWVARLGIPVRRGVEITGLAQDDTGVTVELASGRPVRCGWLVGCDGGRSTVRRAAGFDFPGTAPTITGHQALVEIADPEQLRLGWHRTPVGMVVYGPVPGRIVTVEYDGPPADRDAPVTLDELQASLRRVSGTDVTLTGVVSATRFTDNARQASTYRKGRVLLAGDAAHVHSPFGGQGLNLGIGDAVNLGWKLAAMVEGWAPDGLLDTYTAERHPVGARVLDWTRAQVALMRPDPHTTALRAVVADLMATDDGNAYFLRRTAGIWTDPDSSSPVGRRAPEMTLPDGTRLADHCHSGRPVLLGSPEVLAVAEPWSDRLTTIAVPESALLVRPDGHVAWTTDIDTLAGALTSWFGAPARMPAPTG